MIRTVKTQPVVEMSGGVGRFLTITNMADPSIPRMRGIAPVRTVHFDGLPRLLSVILSSRASDPLSVLSARRDGAHPSANNLFVRPLGAGDPPLNLRPPPRSADQAVYIDGDGNSRRALVLHVYESTWDPV